MTVPRPEKAAVVAEVRDRLEASDAVLLTEYRGLNVSQMADLRRSLRAAGGTYTIYKNTMVRLAVADLGIDVADLLTGQGHNDELHGGPGDDTIRGGAGDDRAYGGAGDDSLEGGNGTDYLNGGADTDTCTRGETTAACEDARDTR